MNTKYFNRIIIAVGICSSFLLSSCHKFLDQVPITDADPKFVFSDIPNTYKALIAAYSRLSGDAGYGIRLSLYFPVDNDEMQGPTGSGGDNDRRDIARYAATATNAQINNPFNQLFQGIEWSNFCIDNIPKSALYTTGTDKEKKQLQRMYGEALTLRAQFYFEAIRNWGDLPAMFTASNNIVGSNPFPARVDRDTLYDHIIADLKIAEDLVPWRNELASIGDPIDERITKGVVKGLRARIALFAGGYSLRSDATMKRRTDYLSLYQIALTETNDIINSGQHSLNPNFKSLWKDQVCARVVSDPNGELMFQVSAFGLTGAEDTKLGYYNGPRTNGNGNSSINPLPTYFYLFDSLDTRRDVTIAPYNVNADGVTKTGLALSALNDGKYRRDWITPAVSPTNQTQYLGLKWQILRYADVLLMYAEAENEINGPGAGAYNAVNMVRRRGFGKSLTAADPTVDIPAGLSKSDFFKYIVRERALELGGEGTRKYDLIRWNLLATAIAETKANLTKMGSNTAMSQWTYMAPMPLYSIDVPNLPTSLFYRNPSTADDKNLWVNPIVGPGGVFYKPVTSSTPTPAGTVKVNWVGPSLTASGTTSPLGRYATNFLTGRSELLPLPQSYLDVIPNVKQNPNY